MPLSWNEIRNRAIEFSANWADESSENAEAKTFWDQFFNVFGVSRRRIAVFEKRVDKIDGGKGYIDLFWPGILVAEHKSRGKSLDRAYKQATDYFHGLKDEELPRRVIVSDFTRFQVYDLEDGTETEFALTELPDRINDFGFIAGYEKRTFREQDPVNFKAAEKLAALHDGMLDTGYGGHDLEVYLVRILFCLFAEDTGIFNPRGAFYDFIEQRTSGDGSDLAARLNELFEVLNTPENQRLKTRDEQINSFPYVNGGLFDERLRTAAFDSKLRNLLLECCNIDWGRVSPAIFGSLFQSIMDKSKRRDLGAHYTSERNIMKVIGSLFLDDLKQELEKCGKNKNKLSKFHEKLSSLNFFDPACGCGNFLVITYREIRLLELEVIRRLYGKEIKTLHLLDVIDNYVKVNVDQFYGIEIEEWPSQIARVAMWLIDHQMNEMVSVEFGNAFVRIPLIKSANIVHDNALQIDWADVVNPRNCNYIMGNPPFIGKKEQTKENKGEVLKTYKDVKNAGLIDYVACWFRLAANFMEKNPLIRTAFVSTKSITHGEQVHPAWQPILDKGFKISFAHQTFKWTSEGKGKAAVHCVIIGFDKKPRPQKQLFIYRDVSGDPELILADNINPYLADAPDILIPNRSNPIDNTPRVLEGITPLDNGLMSFSNEEYEELVAEEPASKAWFKPWITGHSYINNYRQWCLWLIGIKPHELRQMPKVKSVVEAVKSFRENSKSSQKFASTPWLFRETKIPQRYLIIPKSSSMNREYIPIGYIEDSITSSSSLIMDTSDMFIFGILISNMHMSWMRYIAGRLKSDYRYSAKLVYNNFPWPSDVSQVQKKRIEDSAEKILIARESHPGSNLADLYDPLAMPSDLRKAHQENDRAVDAAYGRRKFKAEAERVGYLFELYQQKLDS